MNQQLEANIEKLNSLVRSETLPEARDTIRWLHGQLIKAWRRIDEQHETTLASLREMAAGIDGIKVGDELLAS